MYVNSYNLLFYLIYLISMWIAQKRLELNLEESEVA
jgi:hypothetical protein